MQVGSDGAGGVGGAASAAGALAVVRYPSPPDEYTEFSDELAPIDSFDEEDGSSNFGEQGVGVITPVDRRTQASMLLVTLLEFVCHTASKSPDRNKRLFEILCKKLEDMMLIEPLIVREEMAGLRNDMKVNFVQLLDQINQALGLEAGRLAISDGSGQDMMLPHAPINPRLTGLLNGDWSSGFQPINLPGFLPTRYSTDFEQLTHLGKGGYGSVYKVRHRLDGTEYAVKIIPLNEARPDLLMKSLREVKGLARLEHRNVIRYYSAWIQYGALPTRRTHSQPQFSILSGSTPQIQSVPTSRKPSASDTESKSRSVGGLKHLNVPRNERTQSISTGEESSSEQEEEEEGEEGEGEEEGEREEETTGWSDEGSWGDVSMSEGGNTVSWKPSLGMGELVGGGKKKGRSSGASIVDVTDSIVFETSRAQPYAVQEPESDDSQHKSVKPRKNPLNRQPIQAIVPSSSLSHFPSPSIGIGPQQLGLYIQMQLCDSTLSDWLKRRNAKCISRQEWKAVDVEANRKILGQLFDGVAYIHSKGHIHRDLKPGNVFLCEPDCNVRIGDLGLVTGCFDTKLDLSPKASTGKTPLWSTAGVGTSTYASPEQLAGAQCSHKCDMYSLGIILFEMFCPMTTAMERAMLIQKVRAGQLPDWLVREFPVEAELVLWLTSTDPDKRPDVTQLVAYFGSQGAEKSTGPVLLHAFGRAVHDRDRNINQLQAEICALRATVARQEAIIHSLHSILRAAGLPIPSCKE